MIELKKFRRQYNYAFIDEDTKKEIRRKLLKAICIPGYQVPYSSPEMPVSRGWGTGALHISLAIIGKGDTYKVIDQGDDASVNACNIRSFVEKTAECKTTFDTGKASVIQTRHRVPEEELTEDQIIVFQVPDPEPLRQVEPYTKITRQMHAEGDYAKMWVALYESYVQTGDISKGPVLVNDRYIMSPSPIQAWDIPNLNNSRCLNLFGAGREKRIYAVPPYTKVEPLEFEDVKFNINDFNGAACKRSGEKVAFLEEIFNEDGKTSYHMVNDTNYLDKIMDNNRPKQWNNKYLVKKRKELNN